MGLATEARNHAPTQGTVLEFRGKTEQRVAQIVATLRASPRRLSYDDLVGMTGAPYDALLFVLATLVEVGMVEREDVPDGPGRPRVYHRWATGGDALTQGGARVLGTR